MYPACVTFDDSTTNSLGVVRGLGRRAVPVVLVTHLERSLAQSSRYVGRILSIPDYETQPDSLIAALLDLSKELGERAVVIPTTDAAALILAEHARALSTAFALNIASVDVLRTLVDKSRFHRAARAARFELPRTLVSPSITELERFARAVEYRGIAKPHLSHEFSRAFGDKTLCFRDRRELGSVAEKLAASSIDYLVQEYVPGDQIYMVYVSISRSGEVLAVLGYDKVRQYPPDAGTGSFCISRRRPELIDSVLGFLRELGFSGLAEAELKLDPRDGRYRLLEINARTTTQSRFSEACGGNDVELTAFLDAAGLPVDADRALDFREDVRWISEDLDLAAFWRLHAQRRLGWKDFLASYLSGPRVWAILDRRDPAPALRWLASFVGSLVRRAARLFVPYEET